jgi:serine protease Do
MERTSWRFLEMRDVIAGGLVAAAMVIGMGAAPSAQERERLQLFERRDAQIGVSVRDLTTEEIAAAKLPQAGGVMVRDVREDSPASRAGLRSGDVIVEFDGERVRSASHFTRLVRETVPGRTVRSTVLRDGARTTLDMTPEAGDRLSMVPPELAPEIEARLRRLPRALPRDFSFQLPDDLDPTPDLQRGAPRARLGITLSPLSDQLASYFGVKEGALVSSVAADSAAAQAGIKAGDVILAINGRSVRDSRDVTREVRAASPGTSLEVRLFRDRKEMTVKVTIPERIDEPRSVLPV